MLPVLVAKLHRSVVAGAVPDGRTDKYFDLDRQTRGSSEASIFLEQAGYKAMAVKYIKSLNICENRVIIKTT